MFAEVYKKENGSLSFELHDLNKPGTYHIYAHQDAVKHTEEEYYIGTGEGNQSEISFPKALETLYYFTLKFEDDTTLLCGFRILPIAGMYNFRDIGGYPTKDGKRVKWGLIFRGDHLYNLKPEGVSYLDDVKLNSIIDFRGESECENYPNQLGHRNIQQYHFIPDGKIAAFAGSLQNGEQMDRHDMQIAFAKEQVKKDPDYAKKSMMNQQVEFVNNPESQKAYRNTLTLMADPKAAPLYFHCKGGKDRTGFAAMLLLGILGVDESIIMYDYLLTNRAREKKNQRYLENFRKMAQGDEAVAQYLFALFQTEEAYLNAALQEIKQNYGTIINYVKEVLLISDEQIHTIQSLYLEDSL